MNTGTVAWNAGSIQPMLAIRKPSAMAVNARILRVTKLTAHLKTDHHDRVHSEKQVDIRIAIHVTGG